MRQILFMIIFMILSVPAYHLLLWGMAKYDVYHAHYMEYQERKAERATPIDNKFVEYMNVLVVGVDSGGMGMNPRADAIVLVSLDQSTGRLRTMSIPRGTLVTTNDGEQKQLKMVYESGGIKDTVVAVRELLGITVHQYVVLDSAALAELIDTLGGVDIYVETKMDYEDPEAGLYIHLPQGYQHMDGETAAKYLRYRSGDLGDIGRVQRQHRFVSAVYGRVLNVDTIAKLPDLVTLLQTRVNTSVEVWDSAELAKVLKTLSAEEPEAMMLPGKPMAGDETAWLPDKDKINEKISELFPKAEEMADEGADESSK